MNTVYTLFVEIMQTTETWSGVSAGLPANVQIATLQQWEPGCLLLRLEHLYQPDEHPLLSRNVSIDLSVRRNHELFANTRDPRLFGIHIFVFQNTRKNLRRVNKRVTHEYSLDCGETVESE